MSDMRLKIGPATAASTIDVTQPTKIVAQHLTTLLRQHAGMYVKPMIQARIGIQVIQRTQRARLGVARAIHAAPHARVDHKARAHAARLERHVDRAIGKAPATERPSGSAQGRELCMRRRVLIELAAIVRPRDDLAVAHYYGSDGYLAHRSGGASLRQRLAHELLVDFGDRHRSPSLLQIQNDAIITTHGEMAERLNAAVLKTVERESVPGVRIPLSPPLLVMHRRHGPLEQRIDNVGYLGATFQIVTRFPPHSKKPNNAAGDKLSRRVERHGRKRVLV